MTCHRGGTALLPSGGTGTTPAGCSSARHRERPRAAGGVAASGPHWSASDGCGRIPRLGQLRSGERECGAVGTWSAASRHCAALTAGTTQSPTRVARNGTSTKPTTPLQDQSSPERLSWRYRRGRDQFGEPEELALVPLRRQRCLKAADNNLRGGRLRRLGRRTYSIQRAPLHRDRAGRLTDPSVVCRKTHLGDGALSRFWSGPGPASDQRRRGASAWGSVATRGSMNTSGAQHSST